MTTDRPKKKLKRVVLGIGWIFTEKCIIDGVKINRTIGIVRGTGGVLNIRIPNSLFYKNGTQKKIRLIAEVIEWPLGAGMTDYPNQKTPQEKLHVFVYKSGLFYDDPNKDLIYEQLSNILQSEREKREIAERHWIEDDRDLNELLEEKSQLQSKLSDFRVQIENLNKRIEELEDVGTMAHTLYEVESENAELQSKITTLESLIVEKDRRIKITEDILDIAVTDDSKALKRDTAIEAQRQLRENISLTPKDIRSQLEEALNGDLLRKQRAIIEEWEPLIAAQKQEIERLKAQVGPEHDSIVREFQTRITGQKETIRKMREALVLVPHVIDCLQWKNGEECDACKDKITKIEEILALYPDESENKDI